MKIEIYKIGNRIAFKTIKKTYCKVTHLTIEQARKSFKNLKKYSWEIEIKNGAEIIL